MHHNEPTTSAAHSALRYVACVSYPRSGHHLTVRVLSHYFTDHFKYCRFYATAADECCQQFPCRDSTVNMTKNHDMESMMRGREGLPKVPEVPYLILVRNFLEAVVSDYHLYLRTTADSVETWHAFARRKVAYYQTFVNKWILIDDDLEKLVVRYEELTTRPLDIFRRIVRYFHPPEPIAERRLLDIIQEACLEDVRPEETRVVENFGVRNHRQIEAFQHFDPEFFAELEALVENELLGLGYALRFVDHRAEKVADGGRAVVGLNQDCSE